MKEQFTSYEIALAVKELGFDEPCFGEYSYNTQLYDKGKFLFCKTKYPFYYPDINPLPRFILAPLWQQLVDWFAQKHHLMISLNFEIDKWNWHIGSDIEYLDIWYHGYKTYYEAREAAILKCIELCKKYQK